MSLRQFEQSHGHGRSPGGDVSEPGDEILEVEAPVESVLKFGEVARGVLRMVGVVGASERVLQIAEQGVDPEEFGMLSCSVAGAGGDALVFEALFAESSEAAQAVTEDGTAFLQMVLSPTSHDIATMSSDSGEFGLDGSALYGLDGGDQRDFGWRTAPTLAAVALASEKGIVDLNRTGESLTRLAFEHHLHQLVLDLPGRVLRGPQMPGELERRDAVLALRQQVDGLEPDDQRQLGAVEDGVCRQGRLETTPTALDQSPAFQLRVAFPSAARAEEAVRPAQFRQRFSTQLRGPEAGLESAPTQPLLELNPILPSHAKPPVLSRFQETSTSVTTA